MSLEEKINSDIKTAMLAREQEKLEAIRAVKAALLLEKTKESGTGNIDETNELKILQKLVKQRRESAGFTVQGTAKILQKRIVEAGIIEKYLPQQMDSEELREKLKQIIAGTGLPRLKIWKGHGSRLERAGRQGRQQNDLGIVKQLLGG